MWRGRGGRRASRSTSTEAACGRPGFGYRAAVQPSTKGIIVDFAHEIATLTRAQECTNDAIATLTEGVALAGYGTVALQLAVEIVIALKRKGALDSADVLHFSNTLQIAQRALPKEGGARSFVAGQIARLARGG